MTRLTFRAALAFGVAAALASATFLAGSATAATSETTISPSIVAPGGEVNVHIHVIGPTRFGSYDLWLIPANSAAAGDGPNCNEMSGGLVVGIIVWDGDDGLAQFAMPDVPDDTYVVGENFGGVMPPCRWGGSIEVSATGEPDTAMYRPPSPWGTTVAIAGLILLIAGTTAGRRRLVAS
jgi:hypothetical protein